VLGQVVTEGGDVIGRLLDSPGDDLGVLVDSTGSVVGELVGASGKEEVRWLTQRSRWYSHSTRDDNALTGWRDVPGGRAAGSKVGGDERMGGAGDGAAGGAPGP
jgi:hypothetical protein